MSKKELMKKHAWKKKAAAALHALLLSVFLLGNRGTLLTVRAENEMTMPAEDSAEGAAQPTQTAEEQLVDTEQGQPEGTTEAGQPENEGQTAQTDTENNGEAVQEQTPLDTSSITMIGDSVMLGAAPSLQELLPGCVIDAKVSRQVRQADAVLTSLESQNAVGQIVVIGLGTNGPFSVEKGQTLIDRLGSGRTIYWVTVYGRDLSWQEDSNATIRTLAENNENVHLIEWPLAAAEHADWICSDGIHLSVAGRAGYAGVVAGELLK